MNPKEDRLSDLPNEIITEILSHLTTKEVVRTEVLSKRWKSVWLSVPTLVVRQWDFMILDTPTYNDDYDFDNAKVKFSNFIYEILIARKLPSFQKVDIVCSDTDNDLVKLWMQVAMKRDVSELNVHFDNTRSDAIPCELTHNLFSYNKLVVLILSGYMSLHFPKTSYCFPKLKEVELVDIDYRDEDALPNLLSSCPILEYMKIIRDRVDTLYDDSIKLVIKSRSLKTLILEDFFDIFGYHEIVFKTLFDAPAVEYLDISSYDLRDYVVKDLSSLVELRLTILNFCKALHFLKSLPQLENLTLHFENPTEEESNISDLDVPSCLITRVKTIEAHYPICGDIEKLRYLLRNAKVLERMTIICYPESMSELYNARLESANTEIVICSNNSTVIRFNKEIRLFDNTGEDY